MIWRNLLLPPSGVKWCQFDSKECSRKFLQNVRTFYRLDTAKYLADFQWVFWKLMWWIVMWFLMHWSHGEIAGCPSLHTCCYSHHYLGRCWSKPNCCLDRATFGGHPLTGPPASLFRLPKLVLSVICAPVATAAAVALVQCGNMAGDMASKGKQTEKQKVKERDTIRKHDEREGPDKKPSFKVKRKLFFQSPCNFICE